MAVKNPCPYCGAPLTKKATHCSHCLRELESVANKMHENKIKNLRKERRNMHKTLPQKIVSTFTGKLALVVCIVIALVIAGMIFSFIFGKISIAIETNKEEKQFAILEEYYVNEQFEELTKYVDDNDIYGYKFQKYVELAGAFYYYNKLLEEWDYYKDMSTKVSPEYRVSMMYWEMYYGLKCMQAAEDAYTDKGLLGNETYLKEIYENAKQFMMTNLLISEATLKDMLLLEDFDEESLLPYAEDVVEALDKAGTIK